MNLLIVFALLVLSFINSVFWNNFFRNKNNKKSFVRRVQDFLLSPFCMFLYKIGFNPTILTVLNFVLGTLSVYFLLNKKLEYFFVLFLLSMISDSFDGLMARLTKNSSKVWGKMDLLVDGWIRLLVLFSFWILYRMQILFYGILSLLFTIVIFFIKKDKIKPKFLLRHFVEPLFILAIFYPYESLTVISLCLFANLFIVVISIRRGR
ncbi:MAG: CDP-alcohol phosphatidyltransferase family protein [Candidatus Aenigmarchaeota archaeon]|nr:CDP-alcohol phosphatidyltransferase family protein [Candidatus Aenigmarchaeota archaeon]